MERLAKFEKASKLKPMKQVTPYKSPLTLPRLLSTSVNAASVATPTSGGGGASTGTSFPKGTKLPERLAHVHSSGGRAAKEPRSTATVSKLHQALSKPVESVKPAGPMLTVSMAAAASSQQQARQMQEVGGGSHHVTGGGGPKSLVETGRETVRGKCSNRYLLQVSCRGRLVTSC